jgi:hypothetical protein
MISMKDNLTVILKGLAPQMTDDVRNRPWCAWFAIWDRNGRFARRLHTAILA